jgi:hypothetical protein
MTDFRAILPRFVVLMLCAATVDGGPGRDAAIRINFEAFDWAATLIAQGRFVADKKGAWSSDHPTPSQENDFVRDHGFGEYAKWYLAVDECHSPDSKARYKFPYGDFQHVHRCGLLAIKNRARKYGYHDIEAAAAELLELIKSAGPGAQKRVD